MVNRRASHAGSWYDNDRRKLASQLENWLSKAEFKHEAKAVIVPHAGYYYRYISNLRFSKRAHANLIWFQLRRQSEIIYINNTLVGPLQRGASNKLNPKK